MFNIKRALSATALTAALAGGVLGLGASTASAAAITNTTASAGGECVFTKRGKLDFIFGEFQRKVTIDYKGGVYHLKKKRSCSRTVHKVW